MITFLEPLFLRFFPLLRAIYFGMDCFQFQYQNFDAHFSRAKWNKFQRLFDSFYVSSRLLCFEHNYFTIMANLSCIHVKTTTSMWISIFVIYYDSQSRRYTNTVNGALNVRISTLNTRHWSDEELRKKNRYTSKRHVLVEFIRPSNDVVSLVIRLNLTKKKEKRRKNCKNFPTHRFSAH